MNSLKTCTLFRCVGVFGFFWRVFNFQPFSKCVHKPIKVNDSGFPTPTCFFLPVQMLPVSEIHSDCSWTFPHYAGLRWILPSQNVHKRHHDGIKCSQRELLDVLGAWECDAMWSGRRRGFLRKWCWGWGLQEGRQGMRGGGEWRVGAACVH